MDFANVDKYSLLLRFNSSFNEKDTDITSLEDYTSRFKEGQKEIYYAFGTSRDSVKQDPHIEIFKRKGLEVLYLFDPIDEFIINALRKFKDYDFKSVDNVDLKGMESFKDSEEKEKKFEDLNKTDEKHFDSLLGRIKKILGDRVTDVKESKRLVDSPSCLVSPDDGFSSQMLKMMKMTNKDIQIQKKIFEVNKDHKLVRNLLKVFKANAKDDYITDVVEQLYESALLQDGTLDDPHNLISRLNRMLEQSSDWYTEVKKYKE
jgi:molecular chaperone HtpG